MFTRSKNVIVEIQAKVHFDQPNMKQIQRKLQNVMPLRIKQKQIGTSRLQTRAVHGSGRVGFGSDPHSTRLNRMNGKQTHGRPNIRVESDGAGHRLSGSEPRVISGLEGCQCSTQPMNTTRTRHGFFRVRVGPYWVWVINGSTQKLHDKKHVISGSTRVTTNRHV